MNDQPSKINEVVRAAYERSRDGLYRYLSRKMNRPGEEKDVEDISQEVFLRLLQAKPEDVEKNPQGWVTSTARHIAADLIRQKLREQNNQVALDDLSDLEQE